MASFVRGWEHAWEVWSAVHEICHTEMVNKIKVAVRSEIKNTKKKETQTVKEYVARIGSLVGVLFTLGDVVSEQEHVEAILEGLPNEYDSLQAIIRGRDEPTTVSHLESLLTIQETIANNFDSDVPLETLLPLDILLPIGTLHLGTPEDNDEVLPGSTDDGAGRGRGGGQGGGRGRRRSGRRRRGGQGSGRGSGGPGGSN